MNISSEISLTSNSSDFLFPNDTKMEIYFYMILLVEIFTILVNFPINSYVIWLIVRGSGNGLAAEIFILSLSICEIFLCVEYLNFIFSNWFIYADIAWMLVDFLDGLITTGRPLFQCLICVERYLAVIHPVTFLKYKPLRYRLMCAAVAWVAIFGFGVLSALSLILGLLEISLTPLIEFLITFSIQLFCCVAVLRALKQSGPGERGREREEENHMKRKAFYLILITTVSMAITYLPMIISMTLFHCFDVIFPIVTAISSACFALGGLVQPVLFFYRVGKLNFIRCQ